MSIEELIYMRKKQIRRLAAKFRCQSAADSVYGKRDSAAGKVGKSYPSN